ncbi:exocyst complex component 5 [Nematostella vectensis]|uniref:exocyst complex component 5 n=1 Tax=Nematostella vectensis TaxID=45351 RepID=UPI00138FD0D3|nr:exocyst complex component 5 [Nematostella vectensis]
MLSLDEFEEPFDSYEYVERLASTVAGGGSKGGPDTFNPRKLSCAFEKTIQDLRALDEKLQGRINKLEELCIKEQQEHRQKATDLQSTYKVAFGLFQELDDRINYVATKVVHLGDQLEGINAPRSRALEAQELMKYFKEFSSQDELTSKVFSDPDQIHEAANIIQKLSLIAQELPSERFEDVKERIQDRYNQVEGDLISQFKHAHHCGDTDKMKACAETLVPFKGYSQCVDIFIEQCQKGQFLSADVFKDVGLVCENVHSLVKDVFGSNAEIVMGKFVQNLHDGVLQKHVQSKLLNFGFDKEQSLKNLFTLYGKAKETSKQLSEYKMGSDSNFLERLRKNLFNEYLSKYISHELEYLHEKSTLILERYYNKIGHQKRERPFAGTGLLTQELQKRIPGRLAAPTEISKETYLSQDVAVNLLQENKVALKRCEMLSSASEMASNAFAIYQKLLDHLCAEHIDYALDMAIHNLPPADPRSPVETVFFDVVDQANAIFHLLEKHFTDAIIRLVGSTPVYAECVRKKKEGMEMMETKLDSGLDRVLTSLVGWIRYILNTEQKKTDFKPEYTPDDNWTGLDLFSCTSACSKSCQFIRAQLERIRDALDGKNLESVLTEFGTRIHRLLFEHLQQYTYSYDGGMRAICDINEYRKCMKEFKIPLLISLFETLHQLVNLLVVVPENLRQVCSGDQLAVLDKSVLQQFIQLRADYRTSKLQRLLV